MGISTFPAAASAAGKTRFQTTLNSGTSYTVPTGVNYLVVTTYGAGGGSGGVGGSAPCGVGGNGNSGGSGGTTTFTGATSGSGGAGGTGLSGFCGNNGIMTNRSATASTANTGMGASSLVSNIRTANIFLSSFTSGPGSSGAIATSVVNTTPGATINYSIGAGGTQGNQNGSGGTNGTAGGSGKIDIEYWA